MNLPGEVRGNMSENMKLKASDIDVKIDEGSGDVTLIIMKEPSADGGDNMFVTISKITLERLQQKIGSLVGPWDYPGASAK